MVMALLEEGSAVDSVERVLEIDFEERSIMVPRVALEPLACNPHADFSSQGLSHPYLQWEEKSRCLLLESFAKAFTNQKAPSFPDSDRSDASILLRQGGQRGPSQERGDTGWGAP